MVDGQPRRRGLNVDGRPLLGVPVLRPEEPLQALVDSVRENVRLLIVDNSEGAIDWDTYDLPADAWVTQPYSNLGCAGAWNAIIRQSPSEPYWLIANADAVATPGTFDYLQEQMAEPSPKWVGVDGDWRVMGLNAEWVETVGWFDEAFHPIYLEDCDMEYRGTVVGAAWYNDIKTGATHGDGQSWKGSDLEQANRRTYPANADYYQEKWGGGWRGGEKFSTPFDRGTPDRCGPVLSRLRMQAWQLPVQGRADDD